MRGREHTRFIAAFALVVLAHAAPLRAEESPVTIQMGPATFRVPPDWLELEDDDIEQGRTVGTVLLTPPPAIFDQEFGVSTAGIDDIVILLHHKPIENLSIDSIALALNTAADKYGIATPDDAALAFDGITFATLRGGPTTAAGKSVTHPLILIGSVESDRYGTTLVSTRIENPAATNPQRRFIISAIFEANGATFEALIQLEASRVLRSSDLGLVDAVAHLVADDPID